MRLSTESSIQSRVIVQGRVWPIRWHRSADCHSLMKYQPRSHKRIRLSHPRAAWLLDWKDHKRCWVGVSKSELKHATLTLQDSTNCNIELADDVETETSPTGNLRVNDENMRRFSQVEGNTACLQRNQEALDVWICHEVVDRGLSLGGSHATVEHDRGYTCATKAPLNELQHGGELGENDGLVRCMIGT